MSVQTTNRVWKQSAASGSQLLLLLAMADWSDDWGYCHPSLDQMAAKCRQTHRNILNLLHALERAGEVRRVARGRGGRGKSCGSVYQVTSAMTAEEIAASEQLSPLARTALAGLHSGEMVRPAPREKTAKTGEKFSPEKFSREKQKPDFSPVFPSALKELINTSDSTPPPAPPAAHEVPEPDTQAEALYRLVRPGHLTVPNSPQRGVALKVLGIYLKRLGSLQEAARVLKPYAAEADARGISPTNLCWLSEWAAVGQIPKLRKKTRIRAKPLEALEDPLIDYDALRRRLEVELAEVVADRQGVAP